MALKEEFQAITDFLLEVGADTEERRVTSVNKRLATNMGREQLFIQNLEDSLLNVFKGKFTPSSYKPRKKTATDRILNLVLSDIHYGSALRMTEVGSEYGPIEEARRTAAVALATADYKPQYRDETELHVHLLGDLFQGRLHDMRDGEPLAHQAAATIYYLVQTMTFLASNFKKVWIGMTPGNHGRFMDRHPKRATMEKFDSLENVVYFAVKMALKHYPNIEFHIPETPFYVDNCFGRYSFNTHGDTVLKIPMPGSAIDVRSIKNQMNEINASHGKGKEYELFCAGHAHTGAVIHLPTAALMINGALIPPDGYANSIGVLASTNGQYLYESTPKYLVGDTRLLRVDGETDKDSSLDSIIKAYDGF